MRKFAVLLVIGMCSLWLTAGPAWAQSSGNFDAASTNATCTIDGTNGNLSTNGTTVTFLSTTIQTSNGNGVTLDIRPSLVTGLFTNTKIDTTTSSTSADVGIQVCVTVDGSSANILPGSTEANGTVDNGCVVYDQRFQQISSQLFSQISECAATVTTTSCSTDADCTTAYPSNPEAFCSIPSGQQSGVCDLPNTSCNFDLILSTLAAHSFDFVAQVPGGSHTVKATWSTIGQGSNTNFSKVESCVGPGIVTVTQTKIFKNSDSSLSF